MVIVIIASLATVVLMLTHSMKQKAYQTKSLGALRQVAAANAAFSLENNNDINVALESSDPRQSGATITKNFWGLLSPFLFSDVSVEDDDATKRALKMRLDSLFSTTDSDLMTGTFQQGPVPYQDNSGLTVPFAFNSNTCGDGVYFKTSAYSDAGQVLYMTFGYFRFDEKDGKVYAPIPKKDGKRTNNIDYFSNKTGAFSFLDGHVEILSPPIESRRFGVKPDITP